jgi:hypothetical protein
MQRCLFSCVVGMIVVSGLPGQDRLPRHAKFPKWITDYEAAKKLARADGKPLFVVLRCEP